MNVTERRHIYQSDVKQRADPNERGASQDDWQSNEDITALDGMANDINGRLDKA